MIFKTQGELDKSLAYWKQILRLQDWWIKATINSRRFFNGDLNEGLCEVDEPRKFARIYLLREEDYSDEAAYPQDHERTLVHELLHIHIHPLKPIEYDYRLEVAEEQAIDAIMDGLIALHRR